MQGGTSQKESAFGFTADRASDLRELTARYHMGRWLIASGANSLYPGLSKRCNELEEGWDEVLWATKCTLTTRT